MSAGEPSRDLLRLIRPELRVELRTALFQAAKDRTSVEAKDIPILTNGVERRIDLIVRPVLRDDDPARGFFLILFADSIVYQQRRRSWIRSSPREFTFLVLASIPLWLIFEFYNLYIDNWFYVGLPENRALRCRGGTTRGSILAGPADAGAAEGGQLRGR